MNVEDHVLFVSFLLQPGDKRLAHSAQMFHYQHQKQQMLSVEKQVPPACGPLSALSEAL